MKSILDKEFKYTPSIGTNLRATFAKVRRKLAAEQRQREEYSPRPSGQTTSHKQIDITEDLLTITSSSLREGSTK